MESRHRYKTINTFSRRPCLNQILSYLVVASENISFWALVQNNYTNQSCRYIMIGLFGASTLLLVLVALKASASDPSDPVMIQFKNGKTSIMAQIGSPCLFCEHCESYVLVSSRHCKICDRCVQRFDHHCIWINNCIGKSNYCIFMVMILLVFANMMVYLVSVALLWVENKWKHFLIPMVINWLISTPVLILAILVLALAILHFFLIYHGLTTFDYIMNKRNAQIAPIQLQTITNTQLSEPNQFIMENGHEVKRDSQFSSQHSGQSRQNHQTQNELAPPPFSAFQNMENQERSSDFQSIDHIKSTQNKLPEKQIQRRFTQINKDDLIEQIQEENFNNFYKKHRGLKLLVGPAVIVRPKRAESTKNIRNACFIQRDQKQADQVQIEALVVSSQNADNATTKTQEIS